MEEIIKQIEISKIKPLKKEWKGNGGLHYSLFKLDGNLALVKVLNTGYEVHILRRNKIPDFFKSTKEQGYDYMINYASNEDFGSYGWFYPSLALAEKRFESLKLTDRYISTFIINTFSSKLYISSK